MKSSRFSGDDKSSYRQYTSTPHLDTADAVTRPAAIGSTFSSQTRSHAPYQSTFSTFSHHKSGVDLRYKDDPNPYKVSSIDEFRIQVQDPYKTTGRVHHHHHAHEPHHHHHQHDSHLRHHHHHPNPAEPPIDDYVNYHADNDSNGDSSPVIGLKRLSLKYDSSQYYQNSSGSSATCDYELPDPDYEGSIAGSSDGSHDHHGTSSESPHTTEYDDYSASISPSEGTASAGSHSSPSPTSAATKISEADLTKIEHALKGRKTTVYVSDSLANLYYLVKPSISHPKRGTGYDADGGNPQSEWNLKYTGVPVMLLDTGETKNRDKRQLQIVLAELGSGLALWKDVIDNLSSYKVSDESPTFHTLHLSTNHSTVVGLSFDDEESAERFSQVVEKLTSDFANISLSGSKIKPKKSKVKVKPSKYVRPKKTDISQPCGFQHVASLGSQDKKLFPSLQSLIRRSDK